MRFHLKDMQHLIKHPGRPLLLRQFFGLKGFVNRCVLQFPFGQEVAQTLQDIRTRFKQGGKILKVELATGRPQVNVGN